MRVEIARLVLDYLKALVWPVVFLIVAFRFKPEIARLIRRIRTLSAPGVDAEFSDEVAEISAETEAAVRQAQRDTQGLRRNLARRPQRVVDRLGPGRRTNKRIKSSMRLQKS